MFRLQIFCEYLLPYRIGDETLAEVGGNLFIRNIIPCSILYVLQKY